MRAETIDFIEEWSASEELCVAPSGETEAQVRQRFRLEAEAAGLTEEEIAIGLADADMPAIIAKHGSKG